MLPWLVFALFGYYLVGNNFDAKLGIIDDHEIAMFLGQDGVVAPSEFVPTLMSTEVGQWGVNTRYRPSYYTLRILESAVWRDNAALWYGARYAILVISMVVAWMIVATYFPQIIAYLFVFYAMTMPFWPDLLTRLGPSEIYALPALLLFVYGMIKDRPITVTLAYLVAVGSKENLLILLPLYLGWMISQIRLKTATKAVVASGVIAVLYTIFIVIGIVIATNKAGVDFYLNNIGYSDRIQATIANLPTIIDNRHLLAPLSVFALMSVWIIFKQKQVKLIRLIVLGVTILLLALSQYVFYNNTLPTNSRYDFPALLLFPVFDLIVAKMVIELTQNLRLGKYVKIAIYLGLALFMLAYVVKRGYILIHNSATRNAATTAAFDTNLRKVLVAAEADPDSTLVFVSNRYFSFEPMISLARFLSAKKIGNKFVIDYTKEPLVSDPLGIDLERRITDAVEGNQTDDPSFARFAPLTSRSESCYSITFGSATPLPDCPTVAEF